MLALLVLAAPPRLLNLLAVDPFVDEVIWLHWTVDLFDFRKPSTFWTPMIADGRPPLHYWILLLTTNLFDNAFVGGRLAAALPSIAATVALYWLGRELICPLTGFLAGVLWALSPLSVFFARIASSDDSLLTSCAILVALASVLLVRQPGLATAAFCGVSVGLAVMAKTTGLITVVTPLLAILTLARPRGYVRLIGPAIGAGAIASVVLLPLVPWLPAMWAKTARHAQVSIGASSSNPTWLDQLIHRDLFQLNVRDALQWVPAYVGLPTIALAGLGLLLIPLQRHRGLLYLTLISAFGLAITLERSTTLFSRYLLPSIFPLYILAACAIVWLGNAAGKLSHGLFQAPELPSVVRTTVVIAGLSLGLAGMLPFTIQLITAPDEAPFPGADRHQYFNQWVALYGLRRVAELIQDHANAGPVNVLITPRSSEVRDLLPHQALRLYLRGERSVRFVEERALSSGRNLTPLRRWLENRAPTFLVLNGTYEAFGATPADRAEYTRSLEAALARNLPEAHQVLYIARADGLSWLSVYRVNGPQ